MKSVEMTNLETNEKKIFKNTSQCSKYLSTEGGHTCSPALIWLICEKKNNTRTAGGKYTFEYTDLEPTCLVGRKKIIRKKGMKYNKKTQSEKK